VGVDKEEGARQTALSLASLVDDSNNAAEAQLNVS